MKQAEPRDSYMRELYKAKLRVARQALKGGEAVGDLRDTAFQSDRLPMCPRGAKAISWLESQTYCDVALPSCPTTSHYVPIRLDPPWPVQTQPGTSKPSWVRPDPTGYVRTQLGTSGPILVHLGTSGPNWVRPDPSWYILVRPGTSWYVLVRLGTSRFAPDLKRRREKGVRREEGASCGLFDQ
jgi:hypothetical protein